MEAAMAITLEQVRALLAADEPNYLALARLGPQLLPHLRSLIASRDEHYASKAAALASRIDDERAVQVLRDAAKSPSPLVRLAVAGGIRKSRRPSAAGVLMALLNDSDAGVRRLAMKASAMRPNSALLAKIGDLKARDPAPNVRSLATRILSRSSRA